MNQEPWWLDLGIKWSEEAMGSCFSCPDKESIPDNHQSKFKVVNVDDDGNELGAGIMELTEDELVLRTRKCDAVKWPYLCLRRYGYDSNLFSFESGRRCQTGQGKAETLRSENANKKSMFGRIWQRHLLQFSYLKASQVKSELLVINVQLLTFEPNAFKRMSEYLHA